MSYITTFEVFRMQKVDHLNRFVVTVAHLNKLVAGQESSGKKKIEYYDKLLGHLITWGPFLLATDASVSLLETQAMLGDACTRYKGKHGTRPPISLYVVAWYPWHYDSTTPERTHVYI